MTSAVAARRRSGWNAIGDRKWERSRAATIHAVVGPPAAADRRFAPARWLVCALAYGPPTSIDAAACAEGRRGRSARARARRLRRRVRAARQPRQDAPNVVLIVTDCTRADYIGAYNPRRARENAEPRRARASESLRSSYAVPEAMPTGLVRRTLLTGMRGFPNRDWVLSPPMPAEVGWTRILPRPADADRGARQGRRLDRLRDRQPVPRRPALHRLPPHARHRRGPTTRRAPTARSTAVQTPRAAQRDREVPAAGAVGHGRGPPPAGPRRLEQHLPHRREQLLGRARDAQRHGRARRAEGQDSRSSSASTRSTRTSRSTRRRCT